MRVQWLRSRGLKAGASEAQARASVAAMVAFNGSSPKTHSGIWRDLAVRKRRTEVDMQIAPIVALGPQHGISCPKLARLVDMIHQIENGALAQSDANLLVLAQA